MMIKFENVMYRGQRKDTGEYIESKSILRSEDGCVYFVETGSTFCSLPRFNEDYSTEEVIMSVWHMVDPSTVTIVSKNRKIKDNE